MVILRLTGQNRMVTQGYRKGVYVWVGRLGKDWEIPRRAPKFPNPIGEF
jgi:hypothetical protein